ncbi:MULTISPECIES: hypothetical protein [Eikenella]|uniref:hypothetical protein n=1 Tax=Eikenella TaxID=538 RepID=UPI0007E07066|nr:MULTISPECIES: hypothetical protein [Eikenella]OAM45960.1 hypothetical protein A7Q03_01285 [Eikenella sp. NML99-0057]
MKEKKALVALALSAVLPSLTHSAPRLEYSIGSVSYPLSGRRSGVAAARRAAKRRRKAGR